MSTSNNNRLGEHMSWTCNKSYELSYYLQYILRNTLRIKTSCNQHIWQSIGEKETESLRESRERAREERERERDMKMFAFGSGPEEISRTGNRVFLDLLVGVVWVMGVPDWPWLPSCKTHNMIETFHSTFSLSLSLSHTHTQDLYFPVTDSVQRLRHVTVQQ